MELAEFIQLGQRPPLLPFLIIGGYAEDVELLIRRNGLNLRDPRYEQLFLKYGSRELYETFVRLLRSP
ncbi:MAG TPA: hypothetical protein P5555_19940 [Candidatus Paceibacterota bacterium]|nr:hypothetical protein [Verrucomicrobiota bacterium]HRZ47456.1 hypothetical protein [Candidatus Paceibacterota bacterium]HRZ92414.1 hypothetical protein [Candidatus Paceibacterota bacterium]